MRLASLTLLLGCLICDSACAARAPEAVEKTIEFSGTSANALGALLGVSASGDHFASFRLGRGAAWAIYLLKHDARETLVNDNNGTPPRYNTVELDGDSLTLSPYWLDLGTRLPQPLVGSFSFESPFIPENLDGDDPWTALMRRLKALPGWTNDERIVWTRCYIARDSLKMCIDVYRAHEYVGREQRVGYAIGVTATLPAPKG